MIAYELLGRHREALAVEYETLRKQPVAPASSAPA